MDWVAVPPVGSVIYRILRYQFRSFYRGLGHYLVIENDRRTLAELLALAPAISTDAGIDAKALKTPFGQLNIAFAGLVPEDLYKNIAGLNPIRLRQAMTYATQVARDKGHGPDKPADLALLIEELRRQ